MLRSKILYSVDPKDYLYNGQQVSLKVIGLFDSIKVHWAYYSTSIIVDKLTNNLKITPDLKSTSAGGSILCDVNSLQSYGIKFSTPEEAKKYIDDFKTKWESSSNNTIQEERDKKLKELDV